MMKTRSAVLWVAAVGGLTLVALRSHGRGATSEPQLHEPATTAAASEGSGARDARLLQTMLAALSARNQPVTSASESVRPTAAAPPAAAEEPPSDGMAYAAQMEQLFSGQALDRGWSHDARASVDGKLTLLAANAEIRSLECRSSLCRLELRHADLDHYRAFVQQAFEEPASALWDGPTFATVLDEQPDGRVLAVAYLSRSE